MFQAAKQVFPFDHSYARSRLKEASLMEEGKTAGPDAKGESPQTPEPEQTSPGEKKTDYALVGIGFLLLLVSIICSALLDQDNSSLRYTLRVVTVVGGGLIGGSLPGLLEVRLPFARGAGALALILLFYAVNPAGWGLPDPSPEPQPDDPTTFTFANAKRITPDVQGYAYPDCVEFEDRENVISIGHITEVQVYGNGVIRGLKFRYGDEWGKLHGYYDEAHYVRYKSCIVPKGHRIIRVDGDVKGWYFTRIRFHFSNGKNSDYYGTTQGKQWEAYWNGNALRTIGGMCDLTRHDADSRRRAVTKMEFHFDDP